MPNLTDLSTVRELCERHNFSTSKGFGQNFIVNPGICPRMADAAGVGSDVEGVLEIGPGIGVLTKELATRAKKVVAVEVDDRLLPILDETLSEFDNVKIILADVLKIDLSELLAKEFPEMKVAVCANLPYYITSPILMHLLQAHLPVENITVLVQKEAAQRICAAPGTRESSAISCAVSFYSRPQLLFTVQPGSFFPAPKVTSAVIRLNVGTAPAVDTLDEAGFFRVVRAAFWQRRKTAVNSIAAGLSLPKAQVTTAMESLGLDARLRPEQLTLADFAALQKLILPAPQA